MNVSTETYDDFRIVRSGLNNFEVWYDNGLDDVGDFLGEFATYGEAARVMDLYR